MTTKPFEVTRLSHGSDILVRIDATNPDPSFCDREDPLTLKFEAEHVNVAAALAHGLLTGVAWVDRESRGTAVLLDDHPLPSGETVGMCSSGNSRRVPNSWWSVLIANPNDDTVTSLDVRSKELAFEIFHAVLAGGLQIRNDLGPLFEGVAGSAVVDPLDVLDLIGSMTEQEKQDVVRFHEIQGYDERLDLPKDRMQRLVDLDLAIDWGDGRFGCRPKLYAVAHCLNAAPAVDREIQKDFEVGSPTL